MIEVRNISKGFKENRVLKNISATFDRGKTNLIIGASGSGKTVLIKSIVGLHDVDEGKIYFDDEVFNEMGFSAQKKIRQEIGMLFQGSALFDSLTAEQNVKFPLRMLTDMNDEEMDDRANFCLQRVNLKNVNKLYPAELSGGMKKRVGIARAIAMNPKYLFCDEPNSGLDPQTANLIDRLIQEITQEFNITTIVVTHDMNSVMEIGDKVSFIYEAEIRWEGTKDDIMRTDNKELVDFVYATKFMKALRDWN